MKLPGWLKADGLLLLTAMIWGLAFVAQRRGMEYIGPFAFNATRFLLGALCMIPFVLRDRRDILTKLRRDGTPPDKTGADNSQSSLLTLRQKIVLPVLTGLVMFMGSSLQQIGLVTTTAGNGGFITCLYVVLVPILYVLGGKKQGAKIWAGALFALVGLYFLTIRAGMRINSGDLFVLASSIFWALHIIMVAKLADRIRVAELSLIQCVVCSLLSFLCALLWEAAPFSGARAALVPILYGGILSTGVAFTLQIVAQKTAHPAHASIILSMESLFAALGGAVVLAEKIDGRTVLGGALMFIGMLVSQVTKQEGS